MKSLLLSSPLILDDNYPRDLKEHVTSVRKRPRSETGPMLTPDLGSNPSFAVVSSAVLDELL